jgi:hypothetical protein
MHKYAFYGVWDDCDFYWNSNSSIDYKNIEIKNDDNTNIENTNDDIKNIQETNQTQIQKQIKKNYDRKKNKINYKK